MWMQGRQVAGFLVALMPACLLGAETSRNYTLEVQPSICVTHGSDEPCQMQLTVAWQGESHDVCLHIAGSDTALHCWESTSQGSVELAFHSADDITLQLVRASGGQVLQETQITVVSRDVRDTRRRRRHVWSIL